MKKMTCIALTLVLAFLFTPGTLFAAETMPESTETAFESEEEETFTSETETALPETEITLTETEDALTETEASLTETEASLPKVDAASKLSMQTDDRTYSVTEDFGAVGNGVTDDTWAFINALKTAIGADSMVTIEVPAGTYIISSYLFIYSNTHLSLDENAIIRADKDFNNGTLLGACHVHEDDNACTGDGVNDPTCNIGGYDQIQHVIIEGGTWDRNISGDQAAAMFRLVHGNDITIRNTTLMHASDHFVNISGSRNVTIQNVTFKDFVYNYIDKEYVNKNRTYQNECVHTDAMQPFSEASSFPQDDTAARDITVSDCTFINVSDGVGTHYFKTATATIAHSDHIKVTGCTFINLSGRAVNAYSTDNITVEGCTATDCSSFVAAREASGTISGNTVNSTKVHTAHNSWDDGQGIIILDCPEDLPGNGFTISDNSIYNTAHYGIWVARVKVSGSDTHTSHAIVRGNTVYGTKSEEINQSSGDKTKLYDILVGANCTAEITNNNVGLRGVHNFSQLKVTLSNNTTRDTAGKWQRLYGAGRYDTMKTIVQTGFQETGGTAIVATGTNFKDALAAAGLAGLSDAPIILTDGKNLSSQAKAELTRLKPSKIYIAGGTFAISDNVMNQIKTVTNTTIGETLIRLAGPNSSGTSAELALAGKGNWSTTAVIATNKSFKDALSVAPLAFAGKMPIFLADNGQSVSSAVLNAMKDCEIQDVIIVGGKAAVSENVEKQILDAGFNFIKENRLWGNTGVETSAAIAKYGIDHLGMSADNMGVATSQNYPDALAGAAFCGHKNSVLVLADDKAMKNANFPANYKDTITKGYVFGGSFAVGVKTFTYLVCASQ